MWNPSMLIRPSNYECKDQENDDRDDGRIRLFVPLTGHRAVMPNRRGHARSRTSHECVLRCLLS